MAQICHSVTSLFANSNEIKRVVQSRVVSDTRPFASSSRCSAAARLADALPTCRPTRRVIAQVAKPSSAAGDNNKSNQETPPPAPYVNEQNSESTEQSVTPAVGQTAAAEPAAAEPAAAEPAAAEPAAAEPAAASGITAASAAADAGSSSVPAAPSVMGDGGGGGVRGAAAGGGGGAGSNQTVALLTRFNGVGYTFVLAGFLKIVTIGGLTLSAPVDVARTAFGKASPYLMIPVGLGMCWAAKQIVDSGLNESKKFMRYMVGALVILYFGLVKLMYKYEPDGEWVRPPRPRMPGPMAELRADLGDKDLLAGYGSVSDSRSYLPERPQKDLYDDVAWYEGRYPSQLGQRNGEGRGRSRADRFSGRAAAAAVSDTEADYGDASMMDDMLRSRMYDGDIGQPAAVTVVNKRSFLSDGNRR